MKKYIIEIRSVLFTIKADSIDQAKAKARKEYHDREGVLVNIDEAIHHRNPVLTQKQLFDE